MKRGSETADSKSQDNTGGALEGNEDSSTKRKCEDKGATHEEHEMTRSSPRLSVAARKHEGILSELRKENGRLKEKVRLLSMNGVRAEAAELIAKEDALDQMKVDMWKLKYARKTDTSKIAEQVGTIDLLKQQLQEMKEELDKSKQSAKRLLNRAVAAEEKEADFDQIQREAIRVKKLNEGLEKKNNELHDENVRLRTFKSTVANAMAIEEKADARATATIAHLVPQPQPVAAGTEDAKPILDSPFSPIGLARIPSSSPSTSSTRRRQSSSELSDRG